jgi:hypothetical protein
LRLLREEVQLLRQRISAIEGQEEPETQSLS